MNAPTQPFIPATCDDRYPGSLYRITEDVSRDDVLSFSDLPRFSFVTGLFPDEQPGSVTGEVRLQRVRTSNLILPGIRMLRLAWENQGSLREHWPDRGKNSILFPGTIFTSPAMSKQLKERKYVPSLRLGVGTGTWQRHLVSTDFLFVADIAVLDPNLR
jgi:hypothetical protein